MKERFRRVFEVLEFSWPWIILTAIVVAVVNLPEHRWLPVAAFFVCLFLIGVLADRIEQRSA